MRARPALLSPTDSSAHPGRPGVAWLPRKYCLTMIFDHTKCPARHTLNFHRTFLPKGRSSPSLAALGSGTALIGLSGIQASRSQVTRSVSIRRGHMAVEIVECKDVMRNK